MADPRLESCGQAASSGGAVDLRLDDDMGLEAYYEAAGTRVLNQVTEANLEVVRTSACPVLVWSARRFCGMLL